METLNNVSKLHDTFFYPVAMRRGEINITQRFPETLREAGNRLQIIRNVRGTETVFADFLPNAERCASFAKKLNLKRHF